MKTIKTWSLALGLLFLTSSATIAKEVKNIKIKLQAEVNVDLAQFGKYLKDGNPHVAEGLYRTEDCRYLIAIIKNSEKTHDFIGVVVSAENPFWNRGDIKFNFVIDENNNLNGLYYNCKGDSFPVNFKIAANGIESSLIEKVEMEELRFLGLALL
ncbi:MAG: hypothetical protein KDB74_00990 [Flavobacteriales bacterium]|nr:hypothetical protein [Flavobacteriales bacterium]